MSKGRAGRPPIADGRERILDAAERCIGRSGLRGTGLVEVAAEAEVSRPTAYRLFPGGRNEVIAATIARSVDAFNVAIVATLEIKVSYFEIARPGALTSKARILKLGKSIGFYEAELFDEAGTLLARSTSTAIPTPRPTGD